MPGFNRTGPMGMGPGTGGGRGPCGTGSFRNPKASGWFGRGMGRCLWGLGLGLGSGFLRSRGWGRGLFSSLPPAAGDEVSQLKQEASTLRDLLSSIEQRLGELENQKT